LYIILIVIEEVAMNNSTTKEMSTWLNVDNKKFQDLFKKLGKKDQKKLTSEFEKLKGGEHDRS
jgi:hypothetical protein